jgi:hypothetical protein
MGRLVVLKGDPVNGTDTHNVTGTGPGQNSSSDPFTGTGDYTYTGAITDRLSDFATVNGIPIALVTSGSSLDPGEATPPTGGHSGPKASKFTPAKGCPVAAPDPSTTAVITDAVGPGTPNSGAGSALLTVGGTKVLLDSDAIDTCSGTGQKADSKVTAQGQELVTCST